MYKTIVVPLDGSALASKALPVAEQLARLSAGRIVLTRAMEPHGTTIHQRLEYEIEQQPEIEKELRHVADGLIERGVPADTAIYGGEAAQAIDMAATRFQADLIVMSTHGRSGLARLAYGSVAERVLRHGARPVLLVPAHRAEAKFAAAGSVVVPLDGSPVAEQAIAPAVELARSMGVGIELLDVIEPPSNAVYMSSPGSVVPVIDLDEWVEEVKPYLRDMVHTIDGMQCAAMAETIIGYAAASIARVAEEHKATAIVMTTHGRTGLPRLALGSVTNGVLQRATMPVLVVRAHLVDRETGAGKAVAAKA